MREIFIYYQVDPAAAATLASAVCDAQATLMLRHPGLVARRLQREDRGASTQTWMETYAFANADNPGIGPDLQVLIESRLAPTMLGIVGVRHVEIFVVQAG